MNPQESGYQNTVPYDQNMEAAGHDQYSYSEQYNNWNNYYQGNYTDYNNAQNSQNDWKSGKGEGGYANYHPQYSNYYEGANYAQQHDSSYQQDNGRNTQKSYDKIPLPPQSKPSFQQSNAGNFQARHEGTFQPQRKLMHQRDGNFNNSSSNPQKPSYQSANTGNYQRMDEGCLPPQNKLPYHQANVKNEHENIPLPPQNDPPYQQGKRFEQREQGFVNQPSNARGRWGSGFKRGQAMRSSYQKSFIPKSGDNYEGNPNAFDKTWDSHEGYQSQGFRGGQSNWGRGFVQDQEGGNAEENGNSQGKPMMPWQKKFHEFGGKIKRKRNPNHKHLSVKKFVAPKNALMCLMEAHAGINFVEESVTIEPTGNIFTMSVEVNGVKFSGSGQNKDLAKHAAAEAALAGYIRNPIESAESTPWSSIASFAMYKLFNDWKCDTKPVATAKAKPAVPANDGSVKEDNSAELPSEGNVSMQEISIEKVRQPAKQLPEGASAMNPVMLLHQMRPTVQFQTTQSIEDNKTVFVIKTELDGETFSGSGPSTKKAKLQLARGAVKGLFEVDSLWA